MKMIKEIVIRKKIIKDVLEIIDSSIDEKTMADLKTADEKKARKKFDRLISKLRLKLRDYKSANKLGVYGTSRMLKTTQDRLVEIGFEPELVYGVVRKLMY